MIFNSPEDAARPPHPLAVALIDRLRERRDGPVLVVEHGGGRNAGALLRAGFTVVSLDDAPAGGCAGALSSHALLHGTPASIASRLSAAAGALEPGAPFYATFGSVRDRRYGAGEPREAHVFAPADGDEAGVPHTFFDRTRLTDAVERAFAIESLDEAGVDEIAGRWAHERAPLRGAVHWFALLRSRGTPGARTAAPEDAPAWLAMREALWPNADARALADEVAAHFAAETPGERVFLYEDASGSPVGMLELSLRSHAESCTESPVPFIEGWYVAPPARRRGVGRELVRTAERWARAHGYRELASDTQLWNHESALAHRALGFDEVERAIHFRRVLADPPA